MGNLYTCLGTYLLVKLLGYAAAAAVAKFCVSSNRSKSQSYIPTRVVEKQPRLLSGLEGIPDVPVSRVTPIADPSKFFRSKFTPITYHSSVSKLCGLV